MNSESSSLFQKITQQEYLNQNIQNKLEEEGYELITSIGVNRLVFKSSNNTVVKVARDMDKIEKNYDESVYWSSYKDTDLLCPITDNCPHYTWVEMKYCIPAPNEFITFKEKMNNSRIKIDDLHPDNIGRINDNGRMLVCFDYHDVYENNNTES